MAKMNFDLAKINLVTLLIGFGLAVGSIFLAQYTKSNQGTKADKNYFMMLYVFSIIMTILFGWVLLTSLFLARKHSKMAPKVVPTPTIPNKTPPPVPTTQPSMSTGSFYERLTR